MKRSRLPGFVTTPVKWLLAICLLPVVVAAFFQLIKMGPFLHQEGWKSWWLYLVGAASYVIFERLFHKPMWLYVIGHELTHAVSGFLSGARIYKFKVSSKGGGSPPLQNKYLCGPISVCAPILFDLGVGVLCHIEKLV